MSLESFSILPDYKESRAKGGASLITPLKIHCIAYICDYAKRPRAKTTPVKRIRTKPSIKIGCTASLYKYLMTDSSVSVVYR
ncbi:hypothetical protein BD770DRAFT_469199 [Pilaira anomala]|nr:hypothetical protein BD770DRAFT_469199 [Pilaira anomala]